MAKTKNNKTKLNYRRLIMIGIILIGIIVCVTATYVSLYQKNEMTPMKAFEFTEENKPSGTYKSADEFYRLLADFDIYTADDKEPYYNDGKIVSGSKRFTVVTKKKADSVIKGSEIKVQLVLAANWVGYKSVKSSSTTVTLEKNANITISNLDKIWPAKPYLFVEVKQPTLYAYVTWSEYIDGVTNSYHTFLEIDYNSYNRDLPSA